MQTNIQILILKLDGFIRKYYKNQILKGCIYFLSIAIALYVLLVVVEYFAYLSSTLRTFIFYSFLFLNGFVLIKYIIMPFFQLMKLREVISHEEAAIIIGKHFDKVKDKLINVLQLNKLKDQPFNDMSLLQASIDQKITELKPIPFSLAVDFSGNKKYLKYLITPVAIILLLFLVSPKMVADSTKRLISHDKFFAREMPFQIRIINKNLTADQNEDLQLEVELSGSEIPNEISILFDNEIKYKFKKNNSISFNYLFKNLQKDIEFRIAADGFTTEEYQIKVLPKPVLIKFNTELNFPSYLNKRNTSFENNGDMQIPEGTVVKWNFITKNTKKILFHLFDTTLAINPNNDNSFTFSRRFLKNTFYSVKTINQFVNHTDSVGFSIQVIPDLYPSIAIQESVDSSNSKIIYFKGNAKDDYGLSKLFFHYKYVNNQDSSGKKKDNSVQIPIALQQTQIQFYHYWDMNALSIKPGAIIEYYFEIFDNDGVNGDKSARSNIMVYKAPSEKELDHKTDKVNEELANKMNRGIQQAHELQKQLEDLKHDLVNKKQLSWDDKQKLKKMLEKERNLEKNINEIKKENEQKLKEENQYDQLSQTILDKQDQLEKLFNEVMTDDMKQLFQDMEKMMDNLDKNKLQEMLEKMQLSNKDIEKELDRNLELFKQLELEQKLTNTINKLDELTKNQDKLKDKLDNKNESNDNLKKEQENLKDDFKDIRKDLEELQKKNAAMENPEKMEKTDKQEEAIQKDMQNAGEELKSNKRKKAQDAQKKAKEEMDQLSQSLRQMQQQMQQESQEEDINAMREILENLIKLSFEQEALMTKLSKTSINDPQFVKIAQRQRELKDDAKMIEDSLFALSKRVIQIQSIINREISSINMNMGQAIDDLQERRIPEAKSRQQYSMTATNNLALLLSEIVQQMQQESKKKSNSSQCKSGNCKKPGSGESMQSMRKLQEQLNKQMEQMRKQMGEKREPGKGSKPGQRGSNSMEFAKMAAQQEALRNQLNQMKNQMKGGNSGTAKEMDKISKKMEETETDLVNKRITQETILRQQEIMTKMLDSEKAVKEQEYDKKRQSNENKIDFTRNPTKFFEYKDMKANENELLKTMPISLKRYYKNKVNTYFNNLQN